MINFTSMSQEVQQEIVNQGGEIVNDHLAILPEGTESNVPLDNLREGDVVDAGEFVLPDGLVLFANHGIVSK